jgi:Arc/MetJ-type ribon-helix-helix transcriptional regulator
MHITLPPELQEWLEAEVAAGRFDSIDDAIAAAVAALMAGDTPSGADEWIEHHGEQAAASGDVMSGDELFQRLESRLGKVGSSG